MTWHYWPYRIALSVSAVLLFNQAVFAGQFLGGSYPSLATHRENATYAGVAVLVASLAAIVIRWPGRGPWWPIAATSGLFGLIVLQIVLGFLRLLEIHIPLGVSITVLAVLLLCWAWRKHPAETTAAEARADEAVR
jgi:protein-S-isoprenylcysteine O-methyltransferase Ste14